MLYQQYIRKDGSLYRVRYYLDHTCVKDLREIRLMENWEDETSKTFDLGGDLADYFKEKLKTRIGPCEIVE